MSILENEEFKAKQPKVTNDLSKLFYNGYNYGAIDTEEILTKQFEENKKQTACEFAGWINVLYSLDIEISEKHGHDVWVKDMSDLKKPISSDEYFSTQELFELYLKEKH